MDSPFKPGSRVAVYERWSDGVTESFVEKVHKNGNFTLRGSPQQWKPWSNNWAGGKRWSAHQTGGGWDRRRLDFWDEQIDAEISAKIQVANLNNRWRNIRARIEKLKEPTAEICDAIEAALSPHELNREAE